MLVMSQLSKEIESPIPPEREDKVLSKNEESPKTTQTVATAINSSQSSATSVVSSGSNVTTTTTPSVRRDSATATIVAHSEVLERASKFIEGSKEEEAVLLIKDLIKALNKSNVESNQYKIQAQLVSLSAKDADMRYEVENELVKREVQRLKTQNEQVEYLMNKVTSQKQLIKKYKNEILHKNKEVIRLKTKINDYAHTSGPKKRRKSSTSPTSTDNGMLDTLGMLASQVLTEGESQEPPRARFQR